MKKIILNESQLKKILTEGTTMYDKIKIIYNNSQGEMVRTHQPAKLNYDRLVERLYDAMKGLGGTDLDDIRAVFDEIPDLPSLNKLIKTFGIKEGEDLLGWLDGDINYEQEWNQSVYIPFRRMEVRSKELQHSKYKANEVKVKVDEGIKYKFEQKFPCLKGTPGYKVTRATVTKSGQEQLFFSHDKGHNAITMDGTAWLYKGGKYVSQKGKVSCPQTADNFSGDLKEDQPKPVNEQMNGLEGGDGEVIDFSKDAETAPETAPETSTTGTTTGDTKTKKVDTPEKTTSTTETGDWITNFQTQLKKNGVGQHLGTTGPNGDGVDGKLGAKTATAAYSLLKSKGIISEKNISEISLNEDIQKNFNRFL